MAEMDAGSKSANHRSTRVYGAMGDGSGLLQLALVTFLACSLGACDLLTESEDRILAPIGHRNGSPDIVLPDTVNKGQDFTVSIGTYSVGCGRHGGTDVHIAHLRAIISPYLLVPSEEGTLCPAEFVEFDHQATVAFGTTGVATIVVRGSGGSTSDEVTYEFNVVVE